jgi:hypothetical protein
MIVYIFVLNCCSVVETNIVKKPDWHFLWFSLPILINAKILSTKLPLLLAHHPFDFTVNCTIDH